MAISLEQFAGHLADSGLLSAADLKALVDALPAQRKPKDGEQLARELVRQKKLTAYQAQAIYQGKGKGLTLGNYVIIDKLGQGGMGMVLKAEHKRMHRLVALKVLSPAAVKSPDAVRRFHREVEAAAKLEHPNIVTAHDADEAGGTHFLVMQYVEGSDLSSKVKKDGPLSVEQALHCTLQAARGLEYAHGRGVVHRDIKPSNLLLDHEGAVKILDMGLARIESSALGSDHAELTTSGQIMGTVDYMAPEQALNTKNADQRADIYSLGITLWYLLLGRATYGGETVVEKLMAHQTQPIPSLCEARADVPPQLDAVFARMVAKLPADRYQTMHDVVADLESCRSGSGSHLSLSSSSAGGQTSEPTGSSAKLALAKPGTKPALEVTIDSGAVPADTDPSTNDHISLPELQAAIAQPRHHRRTPQRSTMPAWMRDRRVQLGGGISASLLLVVMIVWMLVGGRGKQDADLRIEDGFSDRFQNSDGAPGPGAPTPSPAAVATQAGQYTFKIRREMDLQIPSNGAIEHIALCDNGRYLVTAGEKEPRSLKVWNLQSGAALADAKFSDSATVIAGLPNGPLVFSGRNDGSLFSQNVVTGGGTTLTEHTAPVADLRFSPLDDKSLVSIDHQGNFLVWSQGAQKWSVTRRGQMPPNVGWEFTSDPEQIVMRLRGSLELAVYRFATGEQIAKLGVAHSGGTMGGAHVGDAFAYYGGARVVSLSGQPKLFGWRSVPGQQRPTSHQWMPDGVTLLCTGGNAGKFGFLHAVNTRTGEPHRILDGTTDAKWDQAEFYRLLLSPEVKGSSTLVATTVDNKVIVIDVARATPAASPASTTPPVASGWVDLFNGRDTAGWTSMGDGKWSVVGGVLRSDAGAGWLATDQDYEDFELMLDYKVPPGGNTGIFLRGWPEADPDRLGMLELQLIDDTWPGYARTPANHSMSVVALATPSQTVTATPDQWHTVGVRLEGSRIEGHFDGQEVLDADLAAKGSTLSGLQRKSGRIGLQVKGHPVQFRNIRVRRLGLTPAASTVSPEQPKTVSPETAPAATPSPVTIVPLSELTESHGGTSLQSPWPSRDGHVLYYDTSQSTPGGNQGIFRAIRRDESTKFGAAKRVADGRQPTLSDDELELVCLMGSRLASARRSQSSDLFPVPQPIPELADQPTPKSPALSSNGLLLMFQRSPIEPTRESELAYTTRPSIDAPWIAPKRFPSMSQAERGAAVSWPFLDDDSKLLWWNQGVQPQEVWFARRTQPNGPFGEMKPVTIAGQPLLGRAPRYVAATGEMFFARMVNGDPNLWELAVVKGYRP